MGYDMMESIDATFEKYVRNIEECRSYLDEESIELSVETILYYKRIFLIGDGISGLVAKAFAIRLADLGFDSYFIPDGISQTIDDDDCIIAVSGSGESESVLSAIEVARFSGAKVLGLTSFPESSLNYSSDCCIIIMGRKDIDFEKNFVKRQLSFKNYNEDYLANDFELNAFVFFEGILFDVLKNLSSRRQNFEKEHNLVSRHTVLE